ncbi:MAG: phosphate ABC transporter substrate-binding protein [Chitinophagales bacterium]|nr:phosphate ABC transporter substrate-binding protein [Chitinophagales bacterium]
MATACLIGCGAPSNSIVQVKGSDTEVNLALALAEKFMENNAAASIAVTGGGSGVGIAALVNGKTHIANSSRPMKKDEIEHAKKSGVNPYPIIFAVDGLGIIVHPSNPVDSINFEQLSGIFRGEITNWKQLGGKDMPISTYGRQSNSGTFVFFRDFVVKGDYSTNVKAMNGTSQIVEAIKTDQAGIGYVGVGHMMKDGKMKEGMKALKVKNDSLNTYITPSTETIISGNYPLTRPLFQITNGKPQGTILKFIQFELSPEGQKMVLEGGYFPITTEQREYNRQLGIVP